MSKLKLFVSHSSRLDDVDDHGLPLQHNWQLLADTCNAIRARYDERVEVLVDKQGLLPAQKWNHELNLWLAECHVAIILFSKRAIEKSLWVAKEATILSWRAELEPDFKLIPVMLDGQSSPADLAKDFLGVLKIDENQCIPDAKTADDILAGIVKALGDADDLAAQYPATPLEQLQGGIEKVLREETTPASLEAALHAVGSVSEPNGQAITAKQYANQLARRFLSVDDEGDVSCFNRFQRGLDPLSPQPLYERAQELLKHIRSLWVEPGAAGCILLALKHHLPVAMNGQFLCLADEVLGAQYFTLERYLERAWPGSALYIPVSVTGIKSKAEIKAEIRRKFLGPGLPPIIDAAQQDRMIDDDPKPIVLIVSALNDQGGLPDPRRLNEVSQISKDYNKIVVIFDLGSGDPPTLPKSIRAVQPPLDAACETAAYLGERATRTYLNQKYGIGP